MYELNFVRIQIVRVILYFNQNNMQPESYSIGKFFVSRSSPTRLVYFSFIPRETKLLVYYFDI